MFTRERNMEELGCVIGVLEQSLIDVIIVHNAIDAF